MGAQRWDSRGGVLLLRVRAWVMFLERRLLISLAQLTVWMLCASESRSIPKIWCAGCACGELNWYVLSGMY